MSKLFPANRVALILHGVFVVASATAVFVAAVSGSLPHGWQPDAALGVTLLSATAGGTVAVHKFLTGSQQWDALQAPVPVLTAALPADELAVAPPYVPDPTFAPVSALAPQREDEAARSPSNPEIPS